MLTPSTPSGPFFLTRQSANIMEDLSRQLKHPGIVCLLYGSSGVGKSRLIKQFLDSRVDAGGFRVLDLGIDETLDANSANKKPANMRDLINQVLDALPEQSLLVVDSCDRAEPEQLEQLIAYMHGQGRALEQKLVLVGNTKLPKALAELAERFPMTIHAVDLKPLTLDEMLAFVSSRCCVGLRLVARLDRQQMIDLKATRGLFSQLSSWFQRHQHEIRCDEKSLSQYRWKWIFAVVILLLSVTLFWVNQTGNDAYYRPSVDGGREPAPQSQIDKKQPVEPITLSTPKLATMGTAVPDVAQDDKPPVAMISPDSQKILATMTQSEPQLAVDESDDGSALDQSKELPVSSLLDQRLQATDLWLSSSDNTMASIQIMSIEESDSAVSALNRYLDNLQGEGIDLEQIMVFKSTRKDRRLFGILFGQYSRRSTAFQAIKAIPPALKANQPIPRTVKGIKDEISADTVLSSE